MLAFYFEITC